MEPRLRTLEELHLESDYAASTATQKIVELEEDLRAKDVKSQMRQLDTRSTSEEYRILELEQHKNLLEVKCNDAEREAKECLENISELNARSRSVVEEIKELIEQNQGYENKITHLEPE